MDEKDRATAKLPAMTGQALGRLNRELKEFRCIPQKEMVGGVCAGVAYRLNLPLWVVRIAWLLMVLGLGFGIVLYLLLWAFVPNAESVPKDYTLRTGGT